MIKEFQKEYRWLSNFWPCRIEFQGRVFNSVEHAYQAAKSDEDSWKEFCSKSISPGEIKKESRNIAIRPTWNSEKVSVMRELLRKKFIDNKHYASMLVDTGSEHIQEGNYWGDRFWGVDLKNSVGKNMLGELIMDIRDELMN
jgi:hypothetical protein